MKLPQGRCACHEPTVKWCGRHGAPLKLQSNERVMTDGEMWMFRECLDQNKAAALAEQIRACARA